MMKGGFSLERKRRLISQQHGRDVPNDPVRRSCLACSKAVEEVEKRHQALSYRRGRQPLSTADWKLAPNTKGLLLTPLPIVPRCARIRSSAAHEISHLEWRDGSVCSGNLSLGIYDSSPATTAVNQSPLRKLSLFVRQKN